MFDFLAVNSMHFFMFHSRPKTKIEMIVKADKLHLKKLLSDAIPLLCKNGLPPHSEFRVEAMIGITVNNSEVALICINETVMADGDIVPQVYGVDEDLDENEELGYPEPGNGPAVNAEECHNGSGTVYGGVIDVEEYGVKQERNDGLEQDMTGYEDAANGVIHPGGYLYDGKMADEVGYGRNTTPRSKKPGSFAVGSDHFVTKEEFDDGTEDCVAVKEELGLDESVFANAFGFQDNARVKSRSSGFRAYKPGANFSSAGETSMQPFPTWQSKTKRMGPLQGRKVPGGKTPAGKTSRNATSLVAPVELQSPVRIISC